MVYDTKAGKVILFGGFKCTSMADPLLNDTWSYDYQSDTWKEMSPETNPPARIYHGMVYEPEAGMTLVWGVVPIHGDELLTHESMLMEAERRAEAAGLVKKGDLVVITAGFPVGGPGSTNTVTVKTVGEQLETTTAV